MRLHVQTVHDGAANTGNDEAAWTDSAGWGCMYRQCMMGLHIQTVMRLHGQTVHDRDAYTENDEAAWTDSA